MAVQAGRRGRSGCAARATPSPCRGSGRPSSPGPGSRPRPTIARRRARTAVRAGRRANRVGILLGAIAIIFVLGFFSLAQTVQVSTTGSTSTA